MTAQNKTTIKSYFETGDRPTQTQFGNLIDSYQDTTASLITLSSASLGSVGLQVLAAGTSAAAQSAIGLGTVAVLNADGLAPIAGGRLTLTTLTPVTTSDVTAATTIYYTPYYSALVPIYNGTAFVEKSFSELSVALDSNSGHTGYQQSAKNFDLFVFSDSGTIRLGTGPAWSSDTSRGTGAGTTELQLLSGVLTNANAITLRFGSAVGNTVAVTINQATYVGTFRATADGQSTDSLAQRLLYNHYNRVVRTFLAQIPTASWSYNSVTIRASNADSSAGSGRVNILLGQPQNMEVEFIQLVDNGAAVGQNYIGIDSTIAGSAQINVIGQVNGRYVNHCKYTGYPGLGFHFLQMLENCQSAASVTFNGASTYQGLRGFIMG